MDEGYSPSDFEQSQFNISIGTIYRINDEIILVNAYSKKNLQEECFRSLKIIFSEIFPFLVKTPKDLEEQKNTEIKIEKLINNSYKNNRGGTKTFVPTEEIDHALRDWDRELRKLMFKHKLYMKMEDKRLPATRT